MEIKIFSEQEIRQAVTLADAIVAMESAFTAFSERSVTVPPVVHMDVPEHRGEVYIKSAHIRRSGECVIKVATGFYMNRMRNLPSGSGLMMLFSAETGFAQAILLDHGYLTDLRTAAAGAVAAKYLATENAKQVAILGAGVQGRFQLEALQCVRKFERVMVYDHHPINTAKFIGDMETRIDARFYGTASAQEALQGSSIIVTCTPSRKPFVQANWLAPGMHITALGADGPDKQELECGVLLQADCIIADSIPQCIQFGELRQAVCDGLLKEEDIDGELGDIIRRRIPGRTNADQITVCDLTGVGVQDAAIATLAFHNASALGLGREF